MAAAKYCQKDGNYISNFDVNAALSKKSCGRDLNRRLLEEALPDLVDEVSSLWRSISSSKLVRRPTSKIELLFFLVVLGLFLTLLANYCLLEKESFDTTGFGLGSPTLERPPSSSLWTSFSQVIGSLTKRLFSPFTPDPVRPPRRVLQASSRSDSTQSDVRWDLDVSYQRRIPSKAGGTSNHDLQQQACREVYPNVFALINARFLSIELV